MATPFPFVAGAVLTAANLNSITELVTNTQTNDYTLAATDAGDRVIANKATAIVFTVPNSVFTASQIVRIHNIGAGTLTISAGAGLTLNGADVLTLAQYQGGELFFTSASSAIFFPTAKTVSAGGLVLISATTVGSGVASVTASSVFSSTYENYLVTLAGVNASTSTLRLRVALGASATSAAHFSIADTFSSSASDQINRTSNSTHIEAGFWSSSGSSSVTMTVYSPNVARHTTVTGQSVGTDANGTETVFASFGGGVEDTTQYTAITFSPNSGTLTGGTIRVYGIANS